MLVQCGPTCGCGKTFEAMPGTEARCPHCGTWWGRVPIVATYATDNFGNYAALIIAAARNVVSHWNEFGSDHGFEESIARLEGTLKE